LLQLFLFRDNADKQTIVSKIKTMSCRSFLSCLVLLFSCILLSCKKDAAENELLYGKWKTSYGDTIKFARESNNDILTYDASMNPVQPVDTKTDFRYINGKLEIKRYPGMADFSRLETFKWKNVGQSFEVQGVEWFMFLSSTTTYFTFTKIQ